jgi:phosphoglycolate phosphatase
MIRLAVFDLDGTLVDSRRDLANAANALVAELGGRPLAEETIAGMVGEGASVLVGRLLAAARLPHDGAEALRRFLELYDQRLVEHTRPYPGIVEMLDVLSARMPLAVLTNKPQAATDRLLAALELARFFGQVMGGDTPLGRKPDPRGLEALARGAGASVASTALVGDSRIDLATARNAGCACVLVSYGFGFSRDLVLQDGERIVDSADMIAAALM